MSIFYIIQGDDETDFVTVSTDIGTITGFSKATYSEFLGIPYAEPPTGSLRFKPPLPVQQYQDFQVIITLQVFRIGFGSFYSLILLESLLKRL